MPHLSGTITPWGPLILVVVGPSAPRIQALTAAGQTPPTAIVARLVVDTGASLTAIDCTILQQLGLTSKGTTPVHTPSTAGVPHNANQYDVGIIIFGLMNAIVHAAPALPVIDGNFKAQGIDWLLGRDVLATSRMSYNGMDGWYGISF